MAIEAYLFAVYKLYIFSAESRVLVPKLVAAADFLCDNNCFCNALGCARLGPGPHVSDLSKRGALPMIGLAAVLAPSLANGCLPKLEVFHGVRKSQPPFSYTTLGLAGKRLWVGCWVPVNHKILIVKNR